MSQQEGQELRIDVFRDHTLAGDAMDGRRLGFPRDLDLIAEAIADGLARAFRSRWTERVSVTLTVQLY